MISSALALASSSACPRATCCSPAACDTSSRIFWERISPALASASLSCSLCGGVPPVGGSTGAARDSFDIGASAGGPSSLLAMFGVLSRVLICFRLSSNDLRRATDKSSSTSAWRALTSPSIRCHPCIRCHSEGCTASASSAAAWGALASPAWCVSSHSSLDGKGCCSVAVCSSIAVCSSSVSSAAAA